VPDAAVRVAEQNGEQVLVPQDNSESVANTAVANTQENNDNVNSDDAAAVDAQAAENVVDPVADEEAAREAAAAAARANAENNETSAGNAQEGALKELQDQVRAIQDSIAALLQQQSTAASPEPVQKAVSSDATTEEVLTKSAQDFVADAVTNALVAFKSEYLDPMVADLQKMSETVEKIAAEPMVKSLAVEAQAPRTTVEEFRKRLTDANGNGLAVSPIRASIAASLARE
jgi:flagellar biosynthesis GTPase FlhF